MDDTDELLDILFLARPAGAEADDAVAVVGFAAKAESNGLFELFHPAVFYGEGDLVRGGVEAEGDPFARERFFDLFGIAVSGAPHLHIEAIFEELIKLDAEEPAFGEECAMLFDHGEEVTDEARVRDHEIGRAHV